MLTSRERCIRSILLEEPDRIPLSLRIRPEPYERLKETLGISDKGGRGRIRLLESLGVDMVGSGLRLKGGYLSRDAEEKEGPYGSAYTVGFKDGFEIRRNIWGVHSIWAPDHTYTYTFIEHPLSTISLDDYVWPEIDETSVDSAQELRKEFEDYCICGGLTHLWEIAWQLTGFPRIMKMMFTEPSAVDRILHGLHEIRMKQATLLCEAGTDLVSGGDDVGTQKGMMMSPKMWRRFLKPRYAELISLCHKKGVFFHFHSDGWIEPIIPDLIEIGVDVLNPVQPETMDPIELKRLYGDKLCFEGTIGIQSTLPFGSPEDVVKEVRERISTIGPTGLILGPTHSMQPDVPMENILSLYETARKYGWSTKRVF